MSNSARTVGAAVAGALVISFSSILYRLAEVSPLTGGFYRLSFAIPVLGILWWRRRGEDMRSRPERWLAVAAGVMLAADIFAWHTGIEYLGAGLATLVANGQVLMVALLAWALFREKPTTRVLISIPIVLVGLAMVSGLGRSDSYGSRPLLGTALSVVASAFYAGYLIAFRRSNRSRAPTAGPLFDATLAATVAIIGFSFFAPLDYTPPPFALGWLLLLGLSSQVVGWLLIGYSLPRLPAAEAAVIILLQPVATLVWASLIFGESPSAIQLTGGTVVLAGVALVVLGPGSGITAAGSRLVKKTQRWTRSR